MHMRTLRPRAWRFLLGAVVVSLCISGALTASALADPPQMLRHLRLDPFNPTLPVPSGNWLGVFPSYDSIAQEGYVDVNGNGIVDATDQIKLRGVWFPILETTQVLTVDIPLLYYPNFFDFLATVEPFPVFDLEGTVWTYIEPNANPATWPTCTVDLWIDADSSGDVSNADEIRIIGPDVFIEGWVSGVFLAISIPGLPPIATETSSWGMVKSLFER